ncbi:MAG: transposase [Burkholderiaceae bacterium]|nr:transposase [Burkholderiaceae bacterium]
MIESMAHKFVPTNSIMDTNIESGSKRRPRGPYRHHSEQFKRAIVEKSFQPGVSVARLARENGINSNQVFNWRQRYVADQHTVAQPSAPALLPVTIAEQPPVSLVDDQTVGALELTVGRAKLRVEGNVDPGLLAQVLDRLLR